MTDQRTPLTAAGRALLRTITETVPLPHGSKHWLTDGILAIEAEAAALDVEPASGDAVRAARFVAEHWRDSYMEYVIRGKNQYGIGTHPLSLVLAALDGETDPRQLGLPESVDEQFRAALAAAQPAPEPLDVPAVLRRAEAAEEDWQAAERRVTLLEAVVKEARAHIRHLIDYPEQHYGAESWDGELDARLAAEKAADG